MRPLQRSIVGCGYVSNHRSIGKREGVGGISIPQALDVEVLSSFALSLAWYERKREGTARAQEDKTEST